MGLEPTGPSQPYSLSRRAPYPGQVLRMKGCGVKDLRSGKPGDQYVKLDIKVPTSLSKEQKEALKNFKEAKKDDGLFSKFKKMFKK